MCVCVCAVCDTIAAAATLYWKVCGAGDDIQIKTTKKIIFPEQLARPTVPKMETEGGTVEDRPPCIETEPVEAMDTQEGNMCTINTHTVFTFTE